MTIDLPVRLLPVTEYWDCHGCGICCRHVIIPLSPEEYARIRNQGWEQDTELAGRRLFVRMSFWKSQYRLAHRPDGYCVFLSPQGHCRIHERFGAEAKPLVCRMFPYQLVALDRFAYLTLRHNCPSVISQHGRSLAEQEDSWRPLVETDRFRMRAIPPPPLTATYRGNWNQFLHVANAVERFLTDTRYPIVRRLVHAVLFAQLLDRCRLAQLEPQRFVELVGLLEKAIAKEADPLFGERVPPDRTAQFVFRRCLLEYYRLHPGCQIVTSWRGRFAWILAAWSMATGRGRVPSLADPEKALRFAPASRPVGDRSQTQTGEARPSAIATPEMGLALGFGQDNREPLPSSHSNIVVPEWVDLRALQESLGGLHRDVLFPLDDYFEKMAISKRYAICGRKGWPLTDRIRALAMSFAAGLGLLLLACPEKKPTQEDVAAVVIALDRGETYRILGSTIYRRRLRVLDRTGQLIRLLLWYSR